MAVFLSSSHRRESFETHFLYFNKKDLEGVGGPAEWEGWRSGRAGVNSESQNYGAGIEFHFMPHKIVKW